MPKKLKEKPEGYTFGRPTTYRPEFVEKAIYYLEHYTDFDDVVPTVEGLALYLGSNRQALYDWAKREGNEDFSDTLKQLNALQSKTLISGSLKGRLNPLISKLLLSKHGYKDQLGISGEGEGEPVKLEHGIKESIDKIYGEGE